VQVQVLGLQNMNRWPCWHYMYRALRGPGTRQGWIRSGKDVVNAKLDLRLRFPLLGRVRNEVILLGAMSHPLGVQRAEGGVEFRAPNGGSMAIAVALHAMERGLS